MSKKLSSRERIKRTLNHKEPDRIPIDLGSTRDTSIVKEGYEELRKFLNLPPSNPILTSNMMRSVKVDEDVHQALGTDFRGIFPGSPGEIEWIDENAYIDAWGVTRVKPENSYYYDQKEFPLSGSITVEDIKNYNWPDPDHPKVTDSLQEQLKSIKNNIDCAIVLTLPACFVHMSQYLRGFKDWFIDCVRDVELLENLFDEVLDINIKIAENVVSEVGKGVDIIMCSDDLGTQQGLQISPKFFRKCIKPRLRRYFDCISTFASEQKILFHSCGSVEIILDDLIDIGVNIINPVQVTAANMKPEILKHKYGDRLCFWGGIDSQRVLPSENIEIIKKEVRHMIEVLGKDGGYVLSAVHNIQPDVPSQNIITMFEYAKKYSRKSVYDQ